MVILIELDGVLLDVRPRHYRLYKEIVGELGLPSIASDDYWRMVRLGEPVARILKTAKPRHVAAFEQAWSDRIEGDALLEGDEPFENTTANLRALSTQGVRHLITMRLNKDGANAALGRYDLYPYFDQMKALSPIRGTRIDQMNELFGENRKRIVVAASDVVLRCARETDAFTVGVASGTCAPRLLRQAGADFVAATFDEFVDNLAPVSPELRQAGWIG